LLAILFTWERVEMKSRKRTQNLAATVFVFQNKRKPFVFHVVYLDQAVFYHDNPEWHLLSTLDPAAWIENILNHPSGADKQIERIKK
jgi:hypothetical protein